MHIKTIKFTFLVKILTKEAITVEELSQILNLVHFADQLNNNQIQNFLILSLCPDGKFTAICFSSKNVLILGFQNQL